MTHETKRRLALQCAVRLLPCSVARQAYSRIARSSGARANHYYNPRMITAPTPIVVGEWDQVQPRCPTASTNCRYPCCRALKDIAVAGQAYGKPVALCAEIASKPVSALALIALGYRKLSLAPSAVGPVKAMVMKLDAGKAEALVNALIASKNGCSDTCSRLRAGITRPKTSTTMRHSVNNTSRP